jgi:hypothetical protein
VFERLPFVVHRVEILNGAGGVAEVAGRFMRQAAAEGFIQTEILKFDSFGSDSGAYWGRNSGGTGVRFWIEIDQDARAAFDPSV